MHEDMPESFFYGSVSATTHYELNISVPGGGQTIYLNEKRYQEYKKDPRWFIENLMGCSFELYQEWVEKRPMWS